MSNEYDITLKKGTSFNLPIVYNDPTGAPINLTGYTARMQVRPYEGGPLVTELNTTNGCISIAAPVSGTLLLSMTPAATAALPTGQYQYDLFIYNASTVVCVVYGNFFIQQEITV
jgi:hypothetical protein